MTDKKEKIILITLALFSLFLAGLIWRVERSLKLRVAEIFVERPYREPNIVVNTDRVFGSMPQIWRAFSQGGEEGAGVRMLLPTITLMQKTGAKYIRIDHIFDDDYYGVCRDKNNLDWSKLDATVDDILSMGAKPFFSLSYMPSMLASSKIEPPRNWQDWQELVKKLVEHYSSKIDGIYFEVWNEPSLNQFGGWKMYGGKDYRELYRYSVLGAQSATNVKPFKIGGPAIPELDSAWIKLLFDFVLTNNLRLDFVSWHRYSLSQDIFINDVYQINLLTELPKYQRFNKIEKVITEWGPNSEKDSQYSSLVAAAHNVAVIRTLLDKVNWAFSFEVKDGPDEQDKGWGLLTHENQGLREKPRFFLYDWLAEFEGERVEVLGEGTQVKGFGVKNGQTNYLILANYLPQGSFEETFNITFMGLSSGKYRVSQQVLFALNQEQEREVTDGKINLTVTLPEYSVMRVRVTRI